MKKYFCLPLLFALVSCTTDGDWSILLFGEGNDIPYSAIHLQKQDQIIVLGQKWTKTDSVEWGNALVKLDGKGNVLDQYFFGKESEEHRSILLHEDRIFIAGYKNDHLNIIEIDPDLKIVKDTSFTGYPTRASHYPQVLSYKHNLVMVFNNPDQQPEILIMDTSFNVIHSFKIRNDFYDGFLSYQDAIITGNSKIVLTGTSVVQPADGRYNYDIFFAQVDMESGVVDWIKSYGDNEGYFSSEALVEWKGKVYATGMGRNNDGDTQDNFDVYLWRIAMDGKIELAEKYSGPGTTEWGNDIKVAGNHLLVAGFSSSSNEQSSYLRLLIDEDGKLIEQKKSGSQNVNALESIVKMDEDNFLLLGCSTEKWGPNSWVIMKMKGNTVMN